jgi:predicted dehydrogenase
MVKVGIIGLGHMGNYHATVCKQINTVNLVAVADPNEKNLEKVSGPKIIKSQNYKEWLDQVDAVIIAVPTQLHYPIAKDCLLSGKHVLVEKPLTKDIKQATELFEIAQKNNCALHIGHVERFNCAVQELKKIIHKPYLIESCRIGPFMPRVQTDSVVLDLMIHDLDIILNLIDSPVKKFSIIGNTIKSNLTDIANVQICFENGVLANLISSRASQIKQRTMCIHQQDAFIKLDFTTQDIVIHKNAADNVQIKTDQMKYSQEGTVERLFIYKDNPLKLEVEHFVKSVKTGKMLSNAKNDLAALSLTLELEKLIQEESKVLSHDCNNSRNRNITGASL